MKAVLKELKKETGLMKDLKFLLNNSNYNYDIYTIGIFRVIDRLCNWKICVRIICNRSHCRRSWSAVSYDYRRLYKRSS